MFVLQHHLQRPYIDNIHDRGFLHFCGNIHSFLSALHMNS